MRFSPRLHRGAVADGFIHGTVVRKSFEVLDDDDPKDVFTGHTGEQVNLRDARLTKAFVRLLIVSMNSSDFPGFGSQIEISYAFDMREPFVMRPGDPPSSNSPESSNHP